MILSKHPNSTIAIYGKGKALDRLSEMKQSNHILRLAIDEYKRALDQAGRLNDTLFKEVATRCIERMRFLGKFQTSTSIDEYDEMYFDEFIFRHIFLFYKYGLVLR